MCQTPQILQTRQCLHGRTLRIVQTRQCPHGRILRILQSRLPIHQLMRQARPARGHRQARPARGYHQACHSYHQARQAFFGSQLLRCMARERVWD